jgi:hypothetical protein
MRNLWLFLPDEALPLLIIGAALALIVGIFRPRAALGLIVSVLLLLILAPFVQLLIAALPGWLLLVLLVWTGLLIFHAVIEFFIGERAAAETVGALTADVIRFGFRLLFLPFRVLAWIFRKA